MADDKFNRKLAVVFATDVVGYSRAMEINENQTLSNLKACRNILDDLFREHGGRIFNTAGDSVLAEFSSAVSAVVCASEFQSLIKERNSTSDVNKKMEFRIGINMGDVVEENGNLYGDGVNIAARLEAFAETNGICLSRNVYELVNSKTQFQFHDLGEQQVKTNRFHAYDVAIEGGKKRNIKSKSTKTVQNTFIMAGLLAAVIVGTFFWLNRNDFEPADLSKFAYELPKKPSIAILPFSNLSGDLTKQYLSDGLTQNITGTLSKSSDIFVIATGSVIKAQENASNNVEISEKLGVRFLVTGGVQQANNDLRVTVELVDTVLGKNIWANKYSGKLDDLFSFQDKIAQNIFENLGFEIGPNILSKASKSHFGNVEEMRELMADRKLMLSFSPANHEKLANNTNARLIENPQSGPANLANAWVQMQKMMMKLTPNPSETIKKGKFHADLAHGIMNDGNSLIVGGWFELFDGNPNEAREKVNIAIQLDPSSGDVIAGAGNIFLLTGDIESARKMFEKAIRIAPYHPAWYANRYAEALTFLGEYEKAKILLNELMRKSADRSVNIREQSRALVGLSVIAGFENKPEEGKEFIKKLRELNPKFSQSSVKNYLGLMSEKNRLTEYLNIAGKFGLPK
ncbi:MAG: adenylate/guanylate cyclase domain-containing protein [Amylibacter sp.]|nr:adenylate/guanylate cyclase domain-containing protein [Amylibacter sp.]